MKKILFVVMALLLAASASEALAFSDNFNDGTYAGSWVVDQALGKPDGTNWEGWKEEPVGVTGVLKNAAYEYYWKKALANGLSAGAGTYSVDIEKDYYSSAGAQGIIWGGDLTNTMYTAGIAWEGSTWDLMLQKWTSPNGGVNWIHEGSWNTTSISPLTAYLWKTLSLQVTDTQASLTMGSSTVNLPLSGATTGNVGLYNSVGWSNFDNFNANPVPEPGSIFLLGSGLLGLFALRKKR